MIVFVIIILIVLLFGNIIKESYNIWKSNPYIRYGKYKVKKLVSKYGKKARTHNKKKYTVVYMPQNSLSGYIRMGSSYTK